MAAELRLEGTQLILMLVRPALTCGVLNAFDPRWDQFVRAQNQGTFFHLSQWRDLLHGCFGYEPNYLYVETNGNFAGILPLFLVRSLLFGKSMVAIPLAVYGGIVAVTEEAAQVLLEKAMVIAANSQARYLEIRGNPYDDGAVSSTARDTYSLKQKDLYYTFIGQIDAAAGVNLSRIPRKQRRMIRQAQKHGLKAVFDNSRLREFYEVYATSVRNLGTPVYGYNYFQQLLKGFGDQCKLLLIEYNDQVIAAVLSFLYKDQVLPYYGGALKEFLHLAPNDFMYWELMSFAAANGYRTFDFGRSKEGTGPFHFKRHWGFEPRPLPYWYVPVKDQCIPDTSSLNPKLQWAIRIWRNLPLKLTMALGPHIVKHIP